MTAHRLLKILIAFIGVYHLAIGFGLMFSSDFQRFCVAAYGASFEWNIRDSQNMGQKKVYPLAISLIMVK